MCRSSKQLHTSLLSAAEFPPWRNWLARLTVIRYTRLMAHQEVESSSLSGGDNNLFADVIDPAQGLLRLRDRTALAGV